MFPNLTIQNKFTGFQNVQIYFIPIPHAQRCMFHMYFYRIAKFQDIKKSYLSLL